MLSMTYGHMPTRQQFDRAWDETVSRERKEGHRGGVQTGYFAFGRDPRLGDCRLTQDELWAELQKAAKEYEEGLQSDSEDPEPTGDWISSVLYCLSIEWV